MTSIVASINCWRRTSFDALRPVEVWRATSLMRYSSAFRIGRSLRLCAAFVGNTKATLRVSARKCKKENRKRSGRERLLPADIAPGVASDLQALGEVEGLPHQRYARLGDAWNAQGVEPGPRQEGIAAAIGPN